MNFAANDFRIFGISLLGLMLGCQSTPSPGKEPAAAAPRALEVSSFTGSEGGFLVNSILILGEKKAVLIDAQLTKSDAMNLIALVQKSGRELETVLITHAHPDHFLGLEFVKVAFPQAKIVASPAVAEAIKSKGDAMLNYWKPMYKENVASKVIVPDVISSDAIVLEDTPLKLESVDLAEAEHQTLIRIPSQNAIVAGDLVYGGVHLWLAEGRPTQWTAALAKIRETADEQTAIYAGHGTSGKGVTLLDANITYLNDYNNAVQTSKSAKDAKALMLSKHGTAKLPQILDIALASSFKAKKEAKHVDKKQAPGTAKSKKK
jgi:glyoxylase-like metal-dependent hydrolase (beta-lactamase superfamily II)